MTRSSKIHLMIFTIHAYNEKPKTKGKQVHPFRCLHTQKISKLPKTLIVTQSLIIWLACA